MTKRVATARKAPAAGMARATAKARAEASRADALAAVGPGDISLPVEAAIDPDPPVLQRRSSRNSAPRSSGDVTGSGTPARGRGDGGVVVGGDGEAHTDDRDIVSATPAKPPRRKPAARKAKAKRPIVRWSVKREEQFLEALGQTGNVREGIRASGLSETSVYRRRRSSDEFRARWAVALREGFARLEALMLERALAGVEKPVWHGGKQVGTIHEYDNRLCLALLSAHRGTVTGAAPIGAEMTDAAIRAAVAERLSEMNRRMGGEG